MNAARRLATLHVLTETGRLFKVDLVTDAWLRADLNDKVPAAWTYVICRCGELIRKCMDGDDQ